MKMAPIITLYSGAEFDFTKPEDSDFKLIDIAHALSNICRFTGHTSKFYSVAQHSVEVSNLLPPEYALQGLVHDAAEAFLGDVSTPLKQLLPDYKAIERRVEIAIFERIGVAPSLHACVKDADLRMLRHETLHLMPEACMNWPTLQGVPPVRGRLVPLGPIGSCTAFMNRYKDITGRDGWF